LGEKSRKWATLAAALCYEQYGSIVRVGILGFLVLHDGGRHQDLSVTFYWWNKVIVIWVVREVMVKELLEHNEVKYSFKLKVKHALIY